MCPITQLYDKSVKHNQRVQMDSETVAENSCARKYRGIMAKLVLTAIFVTVSVILLALIVNGAPSESGQKPQLVQRPEIDQISESIQKPDLVQNNTSSSEKQISKGNGSVVVVPLDQIGISIDDDSYEEQLLVELEKSTKYWFDQAQKTLQDRLLQQPNTNVAKNVIYFMGDGMSLTTITAARIFLGQLQGKRGEETDLLFQTFPNVGLAKTYCLDLQVADSACSATAYLSGVKANMFTQGVNGKVKKDDCEASNDRKNHVNSLLRWAQLAGKSTGLVTNTRITHATPASAYAHSSSRLYESDYDVHKLNANTTVCVDIARQLIESETGQNLNVIFGGGSVKFLPNTTTDSFGKRGERWDGRNLINEWISAKTNAKSAWAYVNNRQNLMDLNNSRAKYVLGLFASQHMSYHSDANHAFEPTLTEMTEAAMNILSTNSNGYVLFVEGGLIDYANHATLAQKAVIETVQFNEAVKLADEKTSERDTMIVVTSDHSHTMSISGYPERGTNILGTMTTSNEGVDPLVADQNDNKGTTSISYAYGPGYFANHDESGNRIDLNSITIDKDYKYITSVGLNDESHGGDDVGIFSRGPFSHLLSGVVEQNYIPHVCAYAACLGPKGTRNRCNDQS